jgi:hypothetical protein
MGFQLKDFIDLRPFVYHLTSRDNLRRLKRTGRIDSAAELMRMAERTDLLRKRRDKHEPLRIADDTVWLRDQLPLNEGSILFEEGWDLPTLIESLNRRVFFWPGRAEGFRGSGLRHLGRYLEEGPALLRIPLDKLLEANMRNPPRLCAYNSGSPRTVKKKKSPRGSTTFVLAEEFPMGLKDVVEVTFENFVQLPNEVEVRFFTVTAWGPLPYENGDRVDK